MSSFVKRPVPFILTTLCFMAFDFIALFSMLGVFLVFFFLLSAVRLADALPLAIVSALLGVIALYFLSSFKGALMRSYSKLAEGGKVSFMDFYNYAVGNGARFFALSLLELLLILLFNAPSAAIYFLYLQANPMPYVDVLLLLASLFITFIVTLAFYPAFASAAVYETGVAKSFGFAFQLFRKKHIFVFLSYAVYGLVCFINMIPLLVLYFVSTLPDNLWMLAGVALLSPFWWLVSFVVMHTIALTGIINLFKANTGMSN